MLREGQTFSNNIQYPFIAKQVFKPNSMETNWVREGTERGNKIFIRSRDKSRF